MPTIWHRVCHARSTSCRRSVKETLDGAAAPTPRQRPSVTPFTSSTLATWCGRAAMSSYQAPPASSTVVPFFSRSQTQQAKNHHRFAIPPALLVAPLSVGYDRLEKANRVGVVTGWGKLTEPLRLAGQDLPREMPLAGHGKNSATTCDG